MSGVGEALRESAVLNLSRAVAMIVDRSSFSTDVTIQALLGFGCKTSYTCRSAPEAQEILQEQEVDLLVVDCDLEGMDGYDLVRWLRRSRLDPNAFAPVIMTAGHVKRTKVAKARDCGANFLITKPFSPIMLLERVVWVARDGRAYLQVGEFFGPDRRFRDSPPPNGQERRADARRAEEVST